MTVCGVLKVWLRAFLTPALDKFKLWSLGPHFNPGNHGIGSWVDPRAGLDASDMWKIYTAE